MGDYTSGTSATSSTNTEAVGTIADAILKAVDNRVQKAKTETKKQIDKASDMDRFVNHLYPVGSIYLTVSTRNPGKLIGGTWSVVGNGTVQLTSGSTTVSVYAWQRTA